jgi:hypothetical protein
LTAYHVTYNRTSTGAIGLLISGSIHKGQVVLEDEHHDLALLKGDFPCPCAPLGRTPSIDDPAVVVGYPHPEEIHGTQWMSRGYIQGTHAFEIYSNTFAEKGMSGGGLFVEQEGQWKLVGTLVQIMGTVANTNRIGGELVFMHISNMTMSTPIGQTREFLANVPEWRQ